MARFSSSASPKPTITWPATETTTYFAVTVKLFQMCVVVEQVAVVLQADECGGSFDRRAEIGERVAQRIDQRKDVEDDQEERASG